MAPVPPVVVFYFSKTVQKLKSKTPNCTLKGWKWWLCWPLNVCVLLYSCLCTGVPFTDQWASRVRGRAGSHNRLPLSADHSPALPFPLLSFLHSFTLPSLSFSFLIPLCSLSPCFPFCSHCDMQLQVRDSSEAIWWQKGTDSSLRSCQP